jgi:type IX secretion system PorP/SprF family membrane protein
LKTKLNQISYFCKMFHVRLIGLKYLVKKRNSFLILLLLVNLAANAQQNPMFSGCFLGKTLHNPAFSGAGNEINASFINRVMLLGIGEGKPITSVFGIEGPVEILGLRSGLGILIKSDQIGFQQQTDVEFNYSYHRDTETGRFGLGLNLGFYNYGIEGEWSVPNYSDYGYTMKPATGDVAIPKNQTKMVFGIGLGAYYQSSDYFMGLSASHLNGTVLRNDTETSAEEAIAFMSYRPHYYLTGGYNIALPDPLFDLRPAVMLRSDLASWQVDVNGTVFYKDKLWAGLGLRSSFISFDAVTVLFGTELFDGLGFTYLLDVNTSALFPKGATNHEVMISYAFNIKTKKNQKYKSVRYL